MSKKYIMTKEEIILRILDVFSTYGIRSLTMDSLSQKIPLAKKELLLLGKNKEALIELVFEYRFQKSEEILNSVLLHHEIKNAIDELLYVSLFMQQHHSNFKPILDFELSKYYPVMYETYQKTCSIHMLNGLIKNIERGINEDIYRTDVDAQIVARIYVEKLHLVFNEILQKELGYTNKRVFSEILINHINSISNENGRLHLETRKTLIDNLLQEE